MSPTYFYASIIIPVLSLILGIYAGQAAVCAGFVACDVIICILLCLEYRQAKRYLEGMTGREQESTGENENAF